jgi:hypothetical protein
MQKFIDLLKGKKTYIIATIIAILAFAQAMGWPIPDYVYAILGACGLGAMRVAVTKAQ